MKTTQKNLVINLLEYWTDYHNTTIGRDIKWDEPEKEITNDEIRWIIIVHETSNCGVSNEFDFIGRIVNICNVNCYMENETGGYRYRLF